MAVPPAIATTALGSIGSILKTQYDKDAPVLAFDRHPFMGMVPKADNFEGDFHVQAVRYEGGQGRSADFSAAQGDQSPNSYIKFIISRFSDFFVGQIANEAMEASKGQAYSMADGIEAEISGGFTTLGISAATACYGTGSGVIGIGAVLLSPTVLKLADPEDIIHFQNNMTLQSSATPVTTLSVPRAGSALVTAIDDDAGTVTVGAGWVASIPAFLPTDSLFVKGDLNAKFPGLLGWIPPVAPVPGDSFFGVDRSVNPVKLSGFRLNGFGAAKADTWQKFTAQAAKYSARLDTGFMNPLDLAELTISIGSQVRRIHTKATETPLVGYDGVEVIGSYGAIKVYADPDCPQGLAWGLKMDTWELLSLGKMPRFFGGDGNKILRSATADAVEFRLGYRAALRCMSPKDNGVLIWLGARHGRNHDHTDRSNHDERRRVLRAGQLPDAGAVRLARQREQGRYLRARHLLGVAPGARRLPLQPAGALCAPPLGGHANRRPERRRSAVRGAAVARRRASASRGRRERVHRSRHASARAVHRVPCHRRHDGRSRRSRR